ncbi:MAG TPA: SCP2 sterol-binding domain-containing protein [Chloroflexota bacterium]|nr:SCP2 sterol-binding domain-containing protein [Chloroflexota bacterium]
MSTPAEILNRIPSTVDPSKIAGINATVVFDLSGDNGGQWTMKVADGAANVSDGADPNASATIKMTDTDYVAMMSGSLNPMMAFMSGKIKVEGDLNTVMKLQSIMG